MPSGAPPRCSILPADEGVVHRLGPQLTREGSVALVPRSIGLFVLAVVFEIGGVWLVWQGVRQHCGWTWIGGGVIALGVYGFVATLQPDSHFGPILAAYGGVFVAGVLAGSLALLSNAAHMLTDAASMRVFRPPPRVVAVVGALLRVDDLGNPAGRPAATGRMTYGWKGERDSWGRQVGPTVRPRCPTPGPGGPGPACPRRRRSAR